MDPIPFVRATVGVLDGLRVPVPFPTRYAAKGSIRASIIGTHPVYSTAVRKTFKLSDCASMAERAMRTVAPW